MSKVIIFTNSNNAVSVCIPTGEIPIEEVLIRDCPSHAFIVDSSFLPEKDNDFFDAWKLDSNNKIYVDIDLAKKIQINLIDAAAKIEAQNRLNNTLIGNTNILSDVDFINMLNKKRLAINAATNTQDIRAVQYTDIYKEIRN
jgi:hypothetical protein